MIQETADFVASNWEFGAGGFGGGIGGFIIGRLWPKFLELYNAFIDFLIGKLRKEPK